VRACVRACCVIQCLRMSTLVAGMQQDNQMPPANFPLDIYAGCLFRILQVTTLRGMIDAVRQNL